MTVWDCFLFNNELRLLEFRLEYLADVVDRVVLVEAPVTFRGDPKPLHFARHAERLERHRHRIHHVVPEGLEISMPTTRIRERRQHAAIRTALDQAGVAADDLVLVGDLDEIPSRETVESLASEPPHRPVRIAMCHARYFANWELPQPWTDGTMAGRGADVDHPDLAVLLGDPDAVWGTSGEPVTAPSGWHLSYLGGPGAIAVKHEQLADTSSDNPRDKDSAHLQRLVDFGVDLSGRHTLRRIDRSNLDRQQQDLLAFAPELFDFTPPPTAADAYRAYTRMRRRLPVSAARIADRIVPPLLAPLGPALVGAERAWNRRRATSAAAAGGASP